MVPRRVRWVRSGRGGTKQVTGIFVFSTAVIMVLGIAMSHDPNKSIDDFNDLIRGGDAGAGSKGKG